jgi:hypothetical protein
MAIFSAVPPPKILPDCSGSDEGQVFFEANHALCNFSLVFFPCLAAIGLPIGFETAPLVEVDENAANLEGRKFMIQALRPQQVRIEGGKLPPFRLMLRHETVLDKKSHKVRAALKEPVTTASRGSRHAPHFRERASILWVAPIIENAHATIDKTGN